MLSVRRGTMPRGGTTSDKDVAMQAGGWLDVIHLTDGPGLGGRSVNVRVQGRSAPGALLGLRGKGAAVAGKLAGGLGPHDRPWQHE